MMTLPIVLLGLASAKDSESEEAQYDCEDCVERNMNTQVCHMGPGASSGVQYTVGEYWEGYEFEPDQDMVDWPDTIELNGKTINPQEYLQADGKHFDIVDYNDDDDVHALSIADKVEICAWLSNAIKVGVAEQLEADVDDFNIAWNIHYSSGDDEWHCHMEYEFVSDDSDDFWIWNCEEVQDEEEGNEDNNDKRRRRVKRRRRRSGYFAYQLGDGDDEDEDEKDGHSTGGSEFGECDGGFYRGYSPDSSLVSACQSGCEMAGTTNIDFTQNTETLINVPVGETLAFSNVEAVYQFYSVASCDACQPSEHPYTTDGYEALLEVIPGSSHTLLNEGLRCFAPYDMDTYEADCTNRVLVNVGGCNREAEVTVELAEAAEATLVAKAIKDFLEQNGVEVTVATEETVEGILPSLRTDDTTTTTTAPEDEDENDDGENEDEDRRRMEQLSVLMNMYDMNITLSELTDLMVNNLDGLNEIMEQYGLPEITAIQVAEAQEDAQPQNATTSTTWATPFLVLVGIVIACIFAYFFWTVCNREEYAELSDKKVATAPTQLTDATSNSIKTPGSNYGATAEALEAGNSQSVIEVGHQA